MPLVEQLLGRCEIRDMLVWNVADLFDKEFQIFSFGEARQLTAIADTDINDLFYWICAKQIEELLSTLLCKSNGKEGNHKSITVFKCKLRPKSDFLVLQAIGVATLVLSGIFSEKLVNLRQMVFARMQIVAYHHFLQNRMRGQ